MRPLLKLLREGLGRVLIFLDWAIKPSIIKRNSDQQNLVNQKTESLKLYEFYACPFCIKTRRAIKRLNLNIETRNAQKGNYRKELELNGGKVQVPCLRIDYAGEVSWLYESNDIINYLDKHF
jgi:glutaredoxin